MQKVALIGLGTMGAGMAARLLAAGFPLTVWNRTRERAEAFAQQGAAVAPSPKEAVAQAEVVISMVADDEASRRVWSGESGVLAGVARGSVLIESSTLSPDWIRELAAAAAQQGCGFLDAPVTGSRAQAASGELLFLVGGNPELLPVVQPVLASLGRGVVHLGPVGSGAVLKLINNFLCGVQAAAFGEALALVERSGLDRAQALSVLLNGAPASPMVKNVAARMAASDYTTHFAVELMRKDLAYAIAEAQRHSRRLETGVAAERLFDQAAKAGLGRDDLSAVIEPLRA